MKDQDPQAVYRFRWTNFELRDFVRGCRDRADILRRDAKILTARAEQIDEEAAAWESALVIADADPGEGMLG